MVFFLTLLRIIIVKILFVNTENRNISIVLVIIMNELRERINRLNKAKFGPKATFASLEREASLTNGTINKWKTGNPSIENLPKIADALDVSLDELCGREGKKNSATESDGNFKEIYDDMTNYVIDTMQESSVDYRLRVAAYAQSLKEELKAQDAQKESE